ncbi:heterochromatin protein 1-like [Culex pipiens pallens]|uniref:heterochromatin protein 1-like n=1 Tax=Culex pipiens pallens TaxID=42434 RepID=UPI001954ED3D|nr:heterochromatin protein 1-like [Culex pipiens pallens]
MASEPEFVVERVVAKRIRRGKAQYQIKWKGCDDSENTWEPEENLNCQDLLEKFAREEGEKRASRGKRQSSADSNSNMDRAGEDVEKAPPKRQSRPRASKSLAPEDTASPPVVPAAKRTKAKNGFEKGHVAEKLEGVTEEGGERLFLVRYKGVDEVELVPSSIARQHVPDLIIDFYESRIIWNNAAKKSVQ